MLPFQTVQTLRTIQMVAPFVFKVRKYYGDGRRQTSVAGEKHIQVNLTKDHEIFDGREANANVIVVCSYQTWNERNGPKCQNKWLCNKRMFTSDQIKEQEGNRDKEGRVFVLVESRKASQCQRVDHKAAVYDGFQSGDGEEDGLKRLLTSGIKTIQEAGSFRWHYASHSWISSI